MKIQYVGSFEVSTGNSVPALIWQPDEIKDIESPELAEGLLRNAMFEEAEEEKPERKPRVPDEKPKTEKPD